MNEVFPFVHFPAFSVRFFADRALAFDLHILVGDDIGQRHSALKQDADIAPLLIGVGHGSGGPWKQWGLPQALLGVLPGIP